MMSDECNHPCHSDAIHLNRQGYERLFSEALEHSFPKRNRLQRWLYRWHFNRARRKLNRMIRDSHFDYESIPFE